MPDRIKDPAELRPASLEERLEDGLCCSLSAFGQLGALLFAAKDMAPAHSQLRKLLDLGWHVAGDMENHVGGVLDQIPATAETQKEGRGGAMSISEKHNELVAEYAKLASAIASLKRDIDADCAIEAADCASIFEEHAFDVLERHGRVK